MGFFSDIFDEVASVVSDVLGVKEIHPDFKEKETARITAELKAEWAAEEAMLLKMMNSSSAKERVMAEKRMKTLQAEQKEAFKSQEKTFLKEKLMGDKAHEENVKAYQEKLREKPPSESGYDKNKIASRVKKARAQPTIPSNISQQERGVGETTRDAIPRRPI